jgi:hypothetical protein
MVAAYFLPLPPPDTERELVQIGEDNETAAGGEKNERPRSSRRVQPLADGRELKWAIWLMSVVAFSIFSIRAMLGLSGNIISPTANRTPRFMIGRAHPVFRRGPARRRRSLAAAPLLSPPPLRERRRCDPGLGA